MKRAERNIFNVTERFFQERQLTEERVVRSEHRFPVCEYSR
jgi:hypothetical protein